MSVVMKLWGDAAGNRTPYDGQYLKDFDFEAGKGLGEASMTPDLAEAKKFPSMKAALEYRDTVPRSKPLRDDLQPNRPLTATNWLFEHIQDEAHPTVRSVARQSKPKPARKAPAKKAKG